LILAGQYDRALFLKAREQICAILDYIESVKPFCYFDVKYSKESAEEIFNDAMLDEYDLLASGTIPESDLDRSIKLLKKADYVPSLVNVYCYMCVDVANYCTAAISFTESFMQTESRTTTDLAAYLIMDPLLSRSAAKRRGGRV
jgi:hypothetical protein